MLPAGSLDVEFLRIQAEYVRFQATAGNIVSA
jgi:hypothetical protein